MGTAQQCIINVLTQEKEIETRHASERISLCFIIAKPRKNYTRKWTK